MMKITFTELLNKEHSFISMITKHNHVTKYCSNMYLRYNMTSQMLHTFHPCIRYFSPTN